MRKVSYISMAVALSLSFIALPGCNRIDAPTTPPSVNTTNGVGTPSTNRAAGLAGQVTNRTGQTGQPGQAGLSGKAGQPAGAGQSVPPISKRTAKFIPRTTLQSRTDLANAIGSMNGLKWATVLQEGNRVYVGVYPAHEETKGATTYGRRTGYSGPKMWDRADEIARQTPDEWIRALNEYYPPADTYDHRPRDRSGTMSPQQQQRIKNLVTSQMPYVTDVLITTDVASVAMLRGYADYIHAGGNMDRFMTEFHQRMGMIWPGGKGVGPNRPSASPNFGPITRAATDKTPVRGAVH